MDDVTIQKEREEAEKNWAHQMEEVDAELKDSHTKREFTFTQVERLELLKVISMNAFAQQIETLAKQLADNILNLNVLPRIGVVPTPEKRILYEPGVGKFALWEPKEKKSTEEQPEPKK